jgi:hypothetical protein
MLIFLGMQLSLARLAVAMSLKFVITSVVAICFMED